MSTQRVERVQEAIRQEISMIIQNEIKDPRIGFLTVTSVRVTRDLQLATVYFSTLGERKDRFLALKGLNSAKGYIRGRIGEKVKMRVVPEIVFRVDETLEQTQRVYELLDKVKKEEEAKRREHQDEGSHTGDQEA